MPRRAEHLKEALGLLRARLNFQGTVMTFSTERTDALWWLMVSADVNANRALIAVLDEPGWREDVGPHGARNAVAAEARALGHDGRQRLGHGGHRALRRGVREDARDRADRRSRSARSRCRSRSCRGQADARFRLARGAARRWALQHRGSGAPWAIVQSRAALPLNAPLFTGYSVKRTVTPVEQKDKAGYSRGDVYRVTLEIDAQTDMTWVVVDDPIPTGAVILGSGLGRDAASLTQGEKREGWAWPAFIERTHEAFRAYYEFVPKGRFKIEYTVRLNNPGRFDLPATRVEAMYSPEMFGELPNAAVAVKP